MSTTPKILRMGEKQFHYIDQGAPLISVHGTMREGEKLSVNDLDKLGKSKTNFTKKASVPQRAYENAEGRAGKVQKADQNLWREVCGKDRCLSKFMEEKESSPSLSGQPTRSTNNIISIARVVVANKRFDWIITGVILLQAIVLALKATPDMHSFGRGRVARGKGVQLNSYSTCHGFHRGIALRLAALYPKPQRYFRDGWNCFDFAIIMLSLLPIAGQFSTVARLVRLLGITRWITKST